jgi:hypothetical protein
MGLAERLAWRRHRRLLPTALAAAGELEYALLDRFVTADAAPIATPRTCEPGPGSWTVTDTTNKASISGGELVMPANTIYDPDLTSVDTYTTVCGTVFHVRAHPLEVWEPFLFYFNKANTKSLRWNNGTVIANGSHNIKVFNDVLYHDYYIIALLPSGLLFVVDDELLTYFDSVPPDCKPVITSYYGSSYKASQVSVFEAGGAFATQFGLATDRKAAPAAGDTLTQEADAVVSFTWAPAAHEVLELMVRRTDDDNCWIVRADYDAGTVKLIEKSEGTETERDSDAATWNVYTTYQIVVAMHGQVIRVYDDRNASTSVYTSASFNQTATGAKVSGFAAGSNFVAWPGVLGAGALGQLTRYA